MKNVGRSIPGIIFTLLILLLLAVVVSEHHIALGTEHGMTSFDAAVAILCGSGSVAMTPNIGQHG
jgi:hypothetical protein